MVDATNWKIFLDLQTNPHFPTLHSQHNTIIERVTMCYKIEHKAMKLKFPLTHT